MKELEKQAIQDLINFYELYLSKGKDRGLIKEKAAKIYEEYIIGFTLLSEDINGALGPLIDIYGNTSINPPTKEEAKKILEKLKKLQKELGQ